MLNLSDLVSESQHPPASVFDVYSNLRGQQLNRDLVKQQTALTQAQAQNVPIQTEINLQNANIARVNSLLPLLRAEALTRAKGGDTSMLRALESQILSTNRPQMGVPQPAQNSLNGNAPPTTAEEPTNTAPGGITLSPKEQQKGQNKLAPAENDEGEKIGLPEASSTMRDYYENLAQAKKSQDIASSWTGNPDAGISQLRAAQEGTPFQRQMMQNDMKNLHESELMNNSAQNMMARMKEYVDVFNSMSPTEFSYLQRHSTDPRLNGKYIALQKIATDMTALSRGLLSIPSHSWTDAQRDTLGKAFASPDQPYEALKLNLKVINNMLVNAMIDHRMRNDYFNKYKTTYEYQPFSGEGKVPSSVLKEIFPHMLKRGDLE